MCFVLRHCDVCILSVTNDVYENLDTILTKKVLTCRELISDEIIQSFSFLTNKMSKLGRGHKSTVIRGRVAKGGIEFDYNLMVRGK
jgi:hypothetical protein